MNSSRLHGAFRPVFALSCTRLLVLLLPSWRKHTTAKTGPVPHVTEDFADPADRDPVVTTAAFVGSVWTVLPVAVQIPTSWIQGGPSGPGG